MYLEAGGQHSSPHFHAYYQDAQAVFTIDPVGMIEGAFPNRQRRLVEAWGGNPSGRVDCRLASFTGWAIAG